MNQKDQIVCIHKFQLWSWQSLLCVHAEQLLFRQRSPQYSIVIGPCNKLNHVVIYLNSGDISKDVQLICSFIALFFQN